jgi:hypothetical protein
VRSGHKRSGAPRGDPPGISPFSFFSFSASKEGAFTGLEPRWMHLRERVCSCSSASLQAKCTCLSASFSMGLTLSLSKPFLIRDSRHFYKLIHLFINLSLSLSRSLSLFYASIEIITTILPLSFFSFPLDAIYLTECIYE